MRKFYVGDEAGYGDYYNADTWEKVARKFWDDGDRSEIYKTWTETLVVYEVLGEDEDGDDIRQYAGSKTFTEHPLVPDCRDEDGWSIETDDKDPHLWVDGGAVGRGADVVVGQHCAKCGIYRTLYSRGGEIHTIEYEPPY